MHRVLIAIATALVGCGQATDDDKASDAKDNAGGSASVAGGSPSGGAPNAQGGFANASGGAANAGAPTFGGAMSGGSTSLSGGRPSLEACEEARPVLSPISTDPYVAYDGVALVERSTKDDLLLVYDLPPQGSTLAAQRLILSAARDGPRLPPIAPGTRLWLTRDRELRVELDSYAEILGWAFTVRDAEGGKVLFGAGYAATSEYAPSRAEPTSTWPLPFLSVADATECVSSTGCNRVAVHPIDVQADERETLTSSGGELRLGDVFYEAAGAKQVRSPSAGCPFPTSGEALWMTVRAFDIAALTRGLPREELSTCARGNEPQAPIYVGGPAELGAAGFAAPVFYLEPGRDIDGNAVYTFAAVPGGSFKVGVTDATGDFEEPALDQEFWATSRAGVTALREARDGRLLYLYARTSLPLSAEFREALLAELGGDVETRFLCAYADPYNEFQSMQSLWEVTFNGDESYVVPSDTQAAISVGGEMYGAWVKSVGWLELSVRAR